MPDTTRELTFGVTVRDNQVGGGSTSFAKVAFSATAEAGPFLVLHPDTANIEYQMGDSILVQWDVANTTAAPVNCENVDIYLSLDNGQEFTELLAANIPNDGEQMVVLPDMTTNRARIKVKCSDNIFFAVNCGNFTSGVPVVAITATKKMMIFSKCRTTTQIRSTSSCPTTM